MKTRKPAIRTNRQFITLKQNKMTLPKKPQIKIYTAIVNQSGTDAPIPIVLHNTFEQEPVFTWTSTGTFTITMTGELTASKTITFLANNMAARQFTCKPLVAPNTLELKQINLSATPLNTFTELYLEIRTYM